ncbi:MAG: phytanoyl-CoA dioxygenase family protein [Parvibaculaceae bacterium]
MPIVTLSAAAETPAIFETLQREGCVVLRDRLNQKEVDRYRGDLKPILDKSLFGDGRFVGTKTKRLGGLFAKSEIAQRAALDSVISEIVQGVLGDNCERYQVNLTQAVEIYPGEPDQYLHADEGLFDYCKIEGERMINVMWALTPFDEKTGGTRVVPGSHCWSAEREPLESEIETAVMDPGSALVWLGSLLHAGGANRSELPRLGTIISYNLGWLRPAENQSLTYPPEVAREFPEKLQDLIGYSVHRPNVGLVENNDPKRLLSESTAKPIQPRDFLTDEGEAILAGLEAQDAVA